MLLMQPHSASAAITDTTSGDRRRTGWKGRLTTALLADGVRALQQRHRDGVVSAGTGSRRSCAWTAGVRSASPHYRADLPAAACDAVPELAWAGPARYGAGSAR